MTLATQPLPAQMPDLTVDIRDRLVRVVVVDPDPLMRAGIRSIMESQPRIHVVGEVDSVRRVGTSVAQIRADILLVGAEHLTDQFRAVLCQLALPVVAIMSADDPCVLRSAVVCAVRGFVDRTRSDCDLSDAVLDAFDGRTYMSSSIAEALVGWAATRMSHEPVSFVDVEGALTPRELEVLEALGDGITNTAIARRLHIQEATVRSHIYHILTKLNLRTRTEAVLRGHGYANNRRAAAA